VGLAIGLRFRVTLLFAAAVLLSVVTVAVAIWAGWTVVQTLGAVLLLLVIQQGFYLIGLFASPRR
jgi:hypothetical protein